MAVFPKCRTISWKQLVLLCFIRNNTET